MATAKKDVTTHKGPAAAKSDQPIAQRQQLDAMLNEEAGKGMEEATRDAFAVPFLRILQDLSPQCKKMKPEFIPGAKPGMIFNTITKELYDKVRVIPCYFTQSYLEWQPRDKGGGLVSVYNMAQGAQQSARSVRDEGKQILPNGNELADTRSHFVLLCKADDTFEGCVIAMSATQIKISKGWALQISYSQQPSAEYRKGLPSFAWWYELGSKEDGNDKGSWYSWTVGPRERVFEIEALQRAKAFYSVMASGQTKVDYAQGSDAPATSGRTLNPDGSPVDLDNEIDA